LVTGRKLLLADDSATIQKVVSLTFRDEGLEVITVSDGREAVEKLEEIAPDIVLADVFMPGLSGYEVCEHIKRNERFRHIPVMLLVGSFEPFDEAEARRVGADDYLTKPFQSIRTLIGKVGNLLSGGGGTASSEEATTRKLAPPPEAEKENRPDKEFIERSTADTAPLNPHDREEMERSISNSRSSNLREVSFADLSMDDQMIKATPAEDYSGGGSSSSIQAEREAQSSRPTAQYSASDLKDAGIKQAVESTRVSDREPSVSAYAPAQAGSEPWPTANQSQLSGRAAASNQPSAEDSLLDLGELAPPQAQAEADDFFLDLLDEAPRQAQPAAPSYVANEPLNATMAGTVFPQAEKTSSAAEDSDASARADYEEETSAPTTQAQEFVDGQVPGEDVSEEDGRAPFEAEASSAPESATVYQHTEAAPAPAREESFAEMQSTAPTERLPEAFRAEEPPSEMGNVQASTAAGSSSSAPVQGQITLEQMSTEVIDAIARRVVEQMSERVIEQIAWEVVPDLAERIIKRRLDAEKQ
jgi:CheY-like chemotaxis protein